MLRVLANTTHTIDQFTAHHFLFLKLRTIFFAEEGEIVVGFNILITTAVNQIGRGLSRLIRDTCDAWRRRCSIIEQSDVSGRLEQMYSIV